MATTRTRPEPVRARARPARGRPRRGVPRRLEGLRRRLRRPRARLDAHRPRRVRLPRGPHRLRQVHLHPPAPEGARGLRRRDPDRRQGARRTMPRAKVPFLRRNIGVVFQDYKLLPNRTVYDNVAYSLQVIGEPRQEIRRKVPDILRLVGPLHQAAQLPRRAVGRRAAARVDRARVREPPAAAAGRRAHRQPRPRDLDRDHAADLPDQPHRHHGRRGHPRQARWWTRCAGA